MYVLVSTQKNSSTSGTATVQNLDQNGNPIPEKNIDITINVNKEKKIINPEISIQNKVYDGTTNISLENINISNLEKNEYILEELRK